MPSDAQNQIGFIENILNEKKERRKELRHEIQTLSETLRILRRTFREDHGSQMRLVPSTEYTELALGKAITKALRDTGEHLSVGDIASVLINGNYQTDASQKNLEASIGTTLRRAWRKGVLDRQRRGRQYKYRLLSKEEREERKEKGGGPEEYEAASE